MFTKVIASLVRMLTFVTENSFYVLFQRYLVCEMTSQKRFRHQENPNTGGRTRDLPPRFKRQKSSSGQPQLNPRAVSPSSPQSDRNNQSNNMTKQSHLQSPGTAVNKASPSQTASSGGVRYSVLQPINYVYSDIPNTQSMPSQVYPLAPSPQMWTGVGYTGLQPVMVSPNSMMLPQPVSQVSHHVRDSTTYINENCAPSPSLYMAQCSPMSPWSTSGYGSPYQSSCSSPAPTIPSPSPSGQEPEKSSQSTPDRMKSVKSPGAHYTDPDLRTIEMLRELERVADKESQEAEEGGSDRKTLVSHHLRMLMCAMDRYTENIESEMDGNTRNDEGISPHSSNRSSPSPSPVPLSRKVDENNLKGKVEGVPTPFWNHTNQTSEHRLPRSRPVLGSSYTSVPTQHRVQPSSSSGSLSGRPQLPQMPWIQDTQPNQQSDWNLWSSPSFNFCGVLGHPACISSPHEHFEYFQDACFPANKERKPLYKR